MPVRILIVDDDAMSREVLSVLLEGEGYAVECADSGDAALTLLGGRGDAPEIVLTDVQMPGTTGTLLAGELRHACGPATLLLAMSGSTPPEATISLFDGFLMKPFKMEAISDALLARTHRANAVKIRAKRKSRGAASGPPRTRLSTTKVASIHAPQTASKKGMEIQVQESLYAGPLGNDGSCGGPVLNRTIYDKLAGSMPTPKLHELYAMCVNDARKRIAAMRRLATARDGERFVREAHAIKGGCGMLGATELYAMAAELELSGLESGGIEGAQNINPLDELAAACDRLERILESRA